MFYPTQIWLVVPLGDSGCVSCVSRPRRLDSFIDDIADFLLNPPFSSGLSALWCPEVVLYCQCLSNPDKQNTSVFRELSAYIWSSEPALPSLSFTCWLVPFCSVIVVLCHFTSRSSWISIPWNTLGWKATTTFPCACGLISNRLGNANSHHEPILMISLKSIQYTWRSIEGREKWRKRSEKCQIHLECSRGCNTSIQGLEYVHEPFGMLKTKKNNRFGLGFEKSPKLALKHEDCDELIEWKNLKYKA